MELKKSYIINEHVDRVALLEQQLDDLRIKVEGIEGFKEEAFKVNNNLKNT